MKEVTKWLLTYFPVAWTAHICQVLTISPSSSWCPDYFPLSGSGDGHPGPQPALPGLHGGCHQQGDQPGLDSHDGGQLSRHPGRGGGVQRKSHKPSFNIHNQTRVDREMPRNLDFVLWTLDSFYGLRMTHGYQLHQSLSQRLLKHTSYKIVWKIDGAVINLRTSY